MKKGVALSLMAAAVALASACGFFTGREFPRHKYQPILKGQGMMDTTTGKACDWRRSDSSGDKTDPFAAYGGAVNQPRASGLPYCGEQWNQ
jgi:hypothetical protein